VIGDVAGVSRPVTSDRFAAFGGIRPVEVSPRRLQDLRQAPRARGAANDATHMAAITQIRHRHCEGRPAKIIRAVAASAGSRGRPVPLAQR